MRIQGMRLWAIGLLFTGCAPSNDTRITVAELAARQQQIESERVPVTVEPEKLLLTGVQPYRVQPGDVLATRVLGLAPEDPYTERVFQFRVDGEGQIRLPFVGPLSVAGLTLAEAEHAIIDAHVPAYLKNMAVFVDLVGRERTTVIVLGVLRGAGLVQLPANERNVLYALAAAGEFGALSTGRVRLKPIRPEAAEIVYNLNDMNDVRRALLAPPLEPGDTLVVEAAEMNAVYAIGLVAQPGPVPIPPQSTTTVVRTIAAAGGLVDFLEPDEATLWRRMPDGKQVRVRIDLTAVLSGATEDLPLQIGDVLEVPHTDKTRFRQWVAKNIQFGPFGMQAVYDPVADYRARILQDDSNGSAFQNALIGGFSQGISNIVAPAPATAP